MNKATVESFRADGTKVVQEAELLVAMGLPVAQVRKSIEDSGIAAGIEEGLDADSVRRVINEVLAVFDQHTSAEENDADGEDMDEESEIDELDALLGELEGDDDDIRGLRTGSLNRYL